MRAMGYFFVTRVATGRYDFFSSAIIYTIMKNGILSRVETEIAKYKRDHRGDVPLFILVSPHEADILTEEVRKAAGYSADTLVTTHKGIKITKYDSLNKGEILLTNELPETSS
jgi:hypothetical protein